MRDTITSLLSSLRGYWKQVFLVALFLFTRTMILYMPPEHSDLPRYWHATLGPGGQPSLQNLASFEYPPLAFAFVNVPRLFHDTQDTYKRSFRALCLAIDILTFGLLACRLSALPLLGYVLGTALLGPVLLDRLDIVLSLCIAIVFFELSAARLPRMALLYTVLGIGTAFKIVPAFGLPALVCYDLSHRGPRRACIGLLVFLVASGLPMLLAYSFVGTGAFYFLTYHAERGTEAESLWACMQMLGIPLGLEVSTYFSHGALNVGSMLESAFAQISLPLLVLSSVLVALPNLSKRTTPRQLWASLGLAYTFVLVVNKVLSPQYFLWWIVATLAFLGPSRHNAARTALHVAIAALTLWIFPYHFEGLKQLNLIAILPLFLRNGLLVLNAILILLARGQDGSTSVPSRPQPCKNSTAFSMWLPRSPRFDPNPK